MAGPVIEAQSADVISNASEEIVIDVPSGTTNGDLLIAFVGNIGNPTDVSPPAGWTEITSTEASFQRLWVGWREASSEPADYTWTFADTAGDRGRTGKMFRISGAKTSAPIDAQNVTTNSTTGHASLAIGGVTTTVADTLILSALVTRWENFDPSASPYTSQPTGMTEQWNFLEDPGDQESGAGGASETQASAGATGDKTWDVENGGSNPVVSIGINLAVAPAAAPTNLTGSSVGASIASATLAVAHTLTGLGAGIGLTSAPLAVARPLAGSAAGAGEAAAPLEVAHTLAGAMAGVGEAVGSMDAGQLMSGSMSGAGQAAAPLTVAYVFTGSGEGSAVASANLTRTFLVGGSAAGSGEAGAPLEVLHVLAGSAEGIGEATGTFESSFGISGSASGAGFAAASIGRVRGFVGLASGRGKMRGEMFHKIVVVSADALPRRLYRYFIADLIGNPREEVPLSGVTWSPALNGAGTLKASIPIDHPKATRENFEPAATSIWVERRGVVVWSGILWAARVQGQTVALDGAGWWSYFARRFQREKLQMTADQAAIVETLLANAQAKDGGSIGLEVNAPTTGVTRSVLYDASDRVEVARAVEELAALEDGFDFYIESQRPDIGAFRKTFRLQYPRRGRKLGARWELRTNLRDIPEWTVDATSMANRMELTGSGEGEQMVAAEEEASDRHGRAPKVNASGDEEELTAMAEAADRRNYPLLERSLSIRDVEEQEILDARAKAELDRVSQPVESLKVRLRDTPDTRVGAWTIGDTVPVIAKHGFLWVDRHFRIMAADISVSEDAEEDVSVQLVAEPV